MDAIILGGLIIGGFLFYGWFVFVWLARHIASIIDIPFTKADDDEVTHLEGEGSAGYFTVREVTRGDRRFRLILLLIVWPVIIALHYVYWEPLYTGVEWLFEDVIAPAVGALMEHFEE